MPEANIGPEVTQIDHIQSLQNQMVMLTLYPEQIFEYGDPEHITSKVAQIKAELNEYGVSGDEILRRNISETCELRAPLHNVVKLDVTKRAG